MEERKNEEMDLEKKEEDDIYGPNGLAHLTLGRPKKPCKHKKKSVIRRSATRKV